MNILRGQEDLSNLSEKYPDFVRICQKSSKFWDDVADLRSQIRFRTLSSELENTEKDLQASIIKNVIILIRGRS